MLITGDTDGTMGCFFLSLFLQSTCAVPPWYRANGGVVVVYWTDVEEGNIATLYRRRDGSPRRRRVLRRRPLDVHSRSRANQWAAGCP